MEIKRMKYFPMKKLSTILTKVGQQQKLRNLKSIAGVEGAWVESHPRSLTAVSLKGYPP